jgi:hypothetical protein
MHSDDCTCTYGSYVKPGGGTGWDVARFDPDCPEHGDCVIPCQWFALCDREATGTTSHPILGEVPTCDRCAEFATS